jgi:hypothetical protein
MNDESCGTMNDESKPKSLLYSSFIIPHSSFSLASIARRAHQSLRPRLVVA